MSESSRYTLWSAASILQKGLSMIDRSDFLNILRINQGKQPEEVEVTEWLHFMNRPLDYPFRRKVLEGERVLDDLGRDLLDYAHELGRPKKMVVKRKRKEKVDGQASKVVQKRKQTKRQSTQETQKKNQSMETPSKENG